MFLASACASPGNAQTDAEDSIFEGDEWVAYLNVRELKEFLNYKSSNLYPISVVKVTYKIRSPQTWEWQSLRNYEQLWYHDGYSVGVHRVEQLLVPPESCGDLVIEPTVDAPLQTKALDSAALRLYLDVALKSASTLRLFAPRDICQQISSDLSSFGFYPCSIIKAGVVGHILHVVSIPAGFDKYYFYRAN